VECRVASFLALVIVMIVPPGPVFPLLIGVSLAEVTMVAVGFNLSTLVVDPSHRFPTSQTLFLVLLTADNSSISISNDQALGV